MGKAFAHAALGILELAEIMLVVSLYLLMFALSLLGHMRVTALISGKWWPSVILILMQYSILSVAVMGVQALGVLSMYSGVMTEASVVEAELLATGDNSKIFQSVWNVARTRGD